MPGKGALEEPLVPRNDVNGVFLVLLPASIASPFHQAFRASPCSIPEPAHET